MVLRLSFRICVFCFGVSLKKSQWYFFKDEPKSRSTSGVRQARIIIKLINKYRYSKKILTADKIIVIKSSNVKLQYLILNSK